MDVGDPSNFARIQELFHGSLEEIQKHVSGARYDDMQIAETVQKVYNKTGYLLDPHGACGYRALQDSLQLDEVGIFLETAHPAKFCTTIEHILGKEIDIPQKLREFMNGKKKSVSMSRDFSDFKQYLLRQ